MRKGLLVSIAVACVGSATAAADPPPSLAVPAGEHLLFKARARGVQIYVCADPNSGGAPEWTLKAPEAQLSDDKGKPIGKHYVGPTWEADDGSKVVGEVVAKVPEPGTIPWLLLRGKASGKGRFAAVTSIQRLDTTGGAAPAGGCDRGKLGAETRVPYGASYAFFGK